MDLPRQQPPSHPLVSCMKPYKIQTDKTPGGGVGGWGEWEVKVVGVAGNNGDTQQAMALKTVK